MEALQVARCEDCGGDVVFIEWPAGWMQTGSSKWGTKYQEDGIAWHCLKCQTMEQLTSRAGGE